MPARKWVVGAYYKYRSGPVFTVYRNGRELWWRFLESGEAHTMKRSMPDTEHRRLSDAEVADMILSGDKR
mgnify:CR=1 FL=1